LGWIEIPSTAPLHIHNRIVEWRHANIEKASKPNGTEARRKRADALLAAHQTWKREQADKGQTDAANDELLKLRLAVLKIQ
jgi:hypothetical protein